MTNAFWKGYDQYWYGISNVNPYEKGTNEWVEWLDGWEDAAVDDEKGKKPKSYGGTIKGD